MQTLQDLLSKLVTSSQCQAIQKYYFASCNVNYREKHWHIDQLGVALSYKFSKPIFLCIELQPDCMTCLLCIKPKSLVKKDHQKDKIFFQRSLNVVRLLQPVQRFPNRDQKFKNFKSIRQQLSLVYSTHTISSSIVQSLYTSHY